MFKRLLLLLIIFLAACTNEPVLVKKDTPPEDPNKKPEIVEQQHDNEEEVDEFIEFVLPDEKVMINLEMVPILNEYLHASQDRKKVIEQMSIDRMDVTGKSLYLLKFSCHNDICSYMLLDQTKDNQAYLIADLAKLIQMEVSLDETKILFHFDRNIQSPVPPSDIVVIELEKWEPVSLVNQTSDKEILDYKWPIITADWNEDQTISATIPDIGEPNLQQWNESDQPTKRIEFSIEAN
ncbi:hypothetical protein [Virgibacillus doumboii]|uniref:hypothetical protein n=1 Tax=Virgibacillus doumboii TaxID=2697503 RepID=UPI0013E07D54|nr:hypothetical protein [Virgibacillus doumboii]